jgi:hypothetical protein
MLGLDTPTNITKVKGEPILPRERGTNVTKVKGTQQKHNFCRFVLFIHLKCVPLDKFGVADVDFRVESSKKANLHAQMELRAPSLHFTSRKVMVGGVGEGRVFCCLWQ